MTEVARQFISIQPLCKIEDEQQQLSVNSFCTDEHAISMRSTVLLNESYSAVVALARLLSPSPPQVRATNKPYFVTEAPVNPREKD